MEQVPEVLEARENAVIVAKRVCVHPVIKWITWCFLF